MCAGLRTIALKGAADFYAMQYGGFDSNGIHGDWRQCRERIVSLSVRSGSGRTLGRSLTECGGRKRRGGGGWIAFEHQLDRCAFDLAPMAAAARSKEPYGSVAAVTNGGGMRAGEDHASAPAKQAEFARNHAFARQSQLK